MIAGIDEAGRGPLAGPVVAAAVILKTREFDTRIADSKKLTERMRERAYDEIFEKAMVGVGVVSPVLIDEINILQASLLAMKHAVECLEVTPDQLLVDGVHQIALNIPQRAIAGGDALELSIMCASIVAKVTRDRMMMTYDAEYPQYGFARHKGYGTKDHMAALRSFGPSPIHRRSFAPVRQSCEIFQAI